MTTTDLYADFVCSSRYNSTINKLQAINSEVAKVVDEHGIGTKLLPDGEYDFEYGQLLDDIPQETREIIRDDETLYNAMLELVEAYVVFARQ